MLRSQIPQEHPIRQGCHQSDKGATFVVKSTLQWAAPWDMRWTYPALDHLQEAGAIEKRNGLLKEKLKKVTG